MPEVLARRTAFLLSKVGQLSREEFDRAVRPTGLRSRHYGVLAVLYDEGSHAQRDLGDKLAIDRSTMVSVVDELEGMGFAERRRNREDRRRYELTLTDAGKRALSAAPAARAPRQRARGQRSGRPRLSVVADSTSPPKGATYPLGEVRSQRAKVGFSSPSAR